VLAGVLIFLALGVAAVYFTIAALIVPKIALPGASPRFAGLFRLGAVSFFVGCGLTHLHIAVHAYTDGEVVQLHELGFHVLQFVGGAFFVWAALRFLTIQVAVTAKTDEERLGHLQELALRDPLTGAYNRRFFEEELGRALAHHRREGAPFAVAQLDVDDFKSVNDDFGHPIGDEVLKRLVMRVSETIRPTDTLVRFGGDEFGLIFHDADAEGAAVVAERLRAAASETPPDGLPPISVSIGIASCPEHGSEAEALVGRSDRALYLSKRSGKNRTTVAPELRPEAAAGDSPLGARA
jgi:diguanylate cyclase (GGDEF)-like protein